MALEHSHGLPDGSVRQTAFEAELLRKAITGRISDDAWRMEVLNQLQRSHPGSNARAAVKAWSVSTGVVNPAVLSVVRQARKQVKVVLVTNATSRLQSDLTALGLLGEFDAVVNSSVVGAVKPDELIYRAALRSAGAAPEQALLVDDSKANVEAARRFGIRALHYENEASMIQFLRDHHVLRDAN